MADHPSTDHSSTVASDQAAWDELASIVPATQSAQLSGGGIPLLRGTFAEMIRHMAELPEDDRPGYVIETAGDRTYSAAEAMALASHPDFPAQGPG